MQKLFYRTIFISFLCLLLLASSCSRTDHANPTLEAIEAMMDEHPDSALMLLTKLDHKSLTNQADSALFNLLLVQAEDKNFIDRTTTERIDIAVNYYRQHPDNDRRLMLSLYYLGNIQNNATLYEQSIISMMEAEQLALKQQDYFYLGLIYRSIAGIYFKVYDVQDEITYEKKSVDAFAKSGHVDYEIYEKCNYANALSHDKRFQEALDTLAVVNKKATEIRDTETLLLMYRFYGVIYFCMGNYDASINAYSSYNSLTSGDLPVESLQVYALSYAKIGCSSKADSILSKIKDLGGEAKASLHKTYFNAGNYQQAYNALLREDYFKDSTLNALLQQRVTQSVFNYNDKVLERERQKAENTQLKLQRSIICILAIVLILIIGLFYLKYRNKVQLLQLHEALRNISVLRAELDRKDNVENLAIVNDNQEELRNQLRHELLSLQQSGNDSAEILHDIINHPTYHKLQQYIETNKVITDRDAIWGDIEKMVCTYSQNFKSRLMLLTNGKLTADDYRIALLIKCGVTPTQLTKLIGRTKGTVSYKRSMLCMRIFDQKLGAKIIDDIIRLL
jgi:tetratricopeptide (TPR) repeat protein